MITTIPSIILSVIGVYIGIVIFANVNIALDNMFKKRKDNKS